MAHRDTKAASGARRRREGEQPRAGAGKAPARKSSAPPSEAVIEATRAQLQAELESEHFLSVKEVAAMLGVGRHRLARALRARQITGVKIGSRFVIRVDEVRRMLGLRA